MASKGQKLGFTLIEFFLSIVALFLLLIISYPILQEYSERSQRSKIIDNLNQIRYYSNQYFNENEANSASLYQFIGPRKKISELKIIADEVYQEQIYRDKEISAYSEKFGYITVY